MQHLEMAPGPAPDATRWPAARAGRPRRQVRFRSWPERERAGRETAGPWWRSIRCCTVEADLPVPAQLHGVGLVDAHALDDRHAAGERLGLLEAVGVEDAVADERRRRLEGQFGAAVPGDLHAASERAARVDQARPDRGEPFAPCP